MDDIDQAISTYEQSVAFTPDDHPDRVGRLNDLAMALYSKFKKKRPLKDLNRAITMNEQVVASAPDDDPNRVLYRSNLGFVLHSRFERTGSMDDLNQAITLNEQVFASALDDDTNRVLYFSNLGIALYSRFERIGSMDDLNRAITLYEQVVASTPEDHSDRAARLTNLGDALHSRFKRVGSMDDLDRAITTYEQTVGSDTALPFIRLNAASSCSTLLIGQQRYDHTKRILETAVQLLPTVSPRQLKRRDQQFNISHFANITSRAVSLNLASAGEPYKSFQMLELGRGFLASLQLEVRSDISLLEASYPDLAKQFQEFRDQIDPPSPRTSDISMIADSSIISNSPSILDLSRSISERRALVKQFNDVLQFIRSLHGFEGFLRGPSESELRSLAKYGPIVVFNVSDIRSDAFIITTNEIRSLYLPLLTSASLEDSARRFLGAINNRATNRYVEARDDLNAVLVWLWDAVVKPVLKELGFTQTPSHGEAWPRVWWVGSGMLNILPIHAAGYHDSTPPETALDYVISSYASTVKSLSYARERVAKANQTNLKEKAILIAMPTTPEQKNLPSVETEVEDLRKLFFNASIDTAVLQNCTRAEVLSELPKYTIVHFTCHRDLADDPSQSHLLLEDWKTAPLTVSDLISLNMESAKLAYLSACHTSATRDFRLLDKSINLSSAIQLSGYPSVVGSLWQVIESDSVKIAKDAYAWILEGGELDTQRSGEGLHQSVRTLREKTRSMSRSTMKNDPLVWAPYIHIGI
jgi:tetratricopeptide (TPR) repeat protein